MTLMPAGAILRRLGKAVAAPLAVVLMLFWAPSALAALPVYNGLMTFPQIDSPAGPEEFSWEVSLGKGQELVQVDGRTAEVRYEDGISAFGIAAEAAHDADGTAVPTTLVVVQPSVITLVVHHRAGNPAAGGTPFVYPVVAGEGWEGGVQTEPVQGPPDEAELHEQAPPGSKPVRLPIGPGVEFTGGFKPGGFSEGRRRPVAVAFSIRVVARGGSRPSALSGFTLRLDRHVAVHLAGLPTCNLGIQVEAETEEVQACKPAWIGGGRIDYSIALPESAEVQGSGRLQIFNGGVSRNGRRLWVYARVNYPVPNAILMKGEIHRSRDRRYGPELVFSVPKIAGGYGSITSLSAVIHRRYGQGRRRSSVLSSTCPNDRGYLGMEALFADGTFAGSQIVRTCTANHR